MKNPTINKDGTVRKQGSGRTKGSTSFVSVTLGELQPYIGDRTPIVVSRVWLQKIGLIKHVS
jgi:hypothetical protein